MNPDPRHASNGRNTNLAFSGCPIPYAVRHRTQWISKASTKSKCRNQDLQKEADVTASLRHTQRDHICIRSSRDSRPTARLDLFGSCAVRMSMNQTRFHFETRDKRLNAMCPQQPANRTTRSDAAPTQVGVAAGQAHAARTSQDCQRWHGDSAQDLQRERLHPPMAWAGAWSSAYRPVTNAMHFARPPARLQPPSFASCPVAPERRNRPDQNEPLPRFASAHYAGRPHGPRCPSATETQCGSPAKY